MTSDLAAIYSSYPSCSKAITDTGFIQLLPKSPSIAWIGSRWLIGDKHVGQCQSHHSGAGFFEYYASNGQVMRLPLCRAVTDSSPLTRFMGVRTFPSITSNWSTVPLAQGPRTLASANWTIFLCAEDNEPLLMNYPPQLPYYKVQPTVFLLSNQHVLSKHMCVCVQSSFERKLPFTGC